MAKDLIDLEGLKQLAEKTRDENKALKQQLSGMPTKVSDLPNDAGYQKAADVEAAIKAQVGSVYKPGGSVTFDALPALDDEHVGTVVNVTDNFTTTDSFLEGKGKQYPAGTNVGVVKPEGECKYDVFSGFVDLSGYVPKDGAKGLSTNDYTTADKTKLTGIHEEATKTEASEVNGSIKIDGSDVPVYDPSQDLAGTEAVTAMLNEVFGGAE